MNSKCVIYLIRRALQRFIRIKYILTLIKKKTMLTILCFHCSGRYKRKLRISDLLIILHWSVNS
uniref:Uncharacterized protein n=1 Tax=Octopus bimaculoides TaxID=37653 RepID=A0A0L8GNS0_OCTBM